MHIDEQTAGMQMTTKRDYYEILGVAKNAGKDEIKKVYRKLAFQYHPDRNKEPGAEGRFKEISEAYAVLSDDQKRNQYDQYGHEGFDRMYSQEDIFRNANFHDFEDLFRQFGFSDPFDDMFGSFFGRSRRRRRNADYGSDLGAEVEITLEEAAKGVKKEIEIARDVVCSKCSGSKSEPGSDSAKCTSCDGKGQVQQSRHVGPMRFYTVTTCGKCYGAGNTVTNPCKKCSGSGKISEKDKLSVKIPKGIENRMQLRLEGMGNQGNDGSGDLYVNVLVKQHKIFNRKGDNLYLDLPISFAQAALGTEIQIPTLFGKAKLNIPKGTQSHTVFKLKGEGMPNIYDGDNGDELVRAIIDVPDKLSKRQKELLEEFAKESGDSLKKRFFDGIFG